MSKWFRVFAGEWRHLVRSPMLIVTFAAVAMVPLLYSGFLIGGTWDPYGKLANLPIAVVNRDQGADFEGKPRSLGEEFVNELRSNDEFAWKFVTAEEAAKGMKGNRYYGTITIPASFSADASSVESEHPKQAEIIFESNSFNNFIAGQIGENAIKELRGRLSETLTEAYSRSMLSQFETVSTGFADAGKGAGDLNAGAVSLSEGIHKLKVNMDALASGTSKLRSGVGPLRTGALQLQDGSAELSSGAAESSQGANRLKTAADQLAKAADDTAAGLDALFESLTSSQSDAAKLTKDLPAAETSLRKLADELAGSAAASGKVAAGAKEAAADLTRLIAAHPELADDAAAQRLLAASKEISQGAQALQADQKEQTAVGKKLADGVKAVVGSAKSLGNDKPIGDLFGPLQTGQQRLLAGVHALDSQVARLAAGSEQLRAGAARLDSGLGGLAGGIEKLTAGIDETAVVARQLSTGAAKLDAEAPRLADGSKKLAAKLNEAGEETAAVKADDTIVHLLADPVMIRSVDDRKVKIYAGGIAPYFISMSLFAGALVFTTIYAARGTRVARAAGAPLLIGKLLVFGLMSLVQSLAVCTLLVAVFGLQVQSIPLFYLFTLMTGLTFMMLVQTLVTWLDQPGRFVVLLLMIFQLSSSAGTFPLELLPGWAQALHQWLPMSYSIRGFRDVISSGDFTRMWHQVGYLSIFLVISVSLTCAYFLTTDTESDDEQLLPVKI
ncbi:YhgE/Pip domain-containing protein [Paenibacillus sacheonensis]|uniref:ABC transporter permease n=1 Tax=Paenibacillus sacheonensis TaxID=742054 RepID=A0A7X4YL24_9BACL|nr:YhgE/Pip domain-containing protein [Paenibacillus sacheonensis]MBM7563161.1 putative membrane protein [Paenibacillus sacheonensis]NBC68275.1 ABC transporter permease [Paenibacillus sacheonensis]